MVPGDGLVGLHPDHDALGRLGLHARAHELVLAGPQYFANSLQAEREHLVEVVDDLAVPAIETPRSSSYTSPVATSTVRRGSRRRFTTFWLLP